MEPALEIRDVTKRFGDRAAVDALTFSVPRGSILGFLGPNGAGKTTTLRMVMSIFLPDAGEIRVLGARDAASVKDRLGYLPEEKGLYKKMRLGELVAYFGMLKGLAARDARRRAERLLDAHGLGDRASAKCETLSKGLGQKVQLLATLVHDPELLILDEPFSGLDPVNTELLRDLILDIKRQGRTVIFSTHVMEQAEQMCDRIVMLDQGRKVHDGTLAAVRGSGDRAIRLDYEGDGAVLRTLPGIARLNDAGQTAEIFLQPGHDPQDVLRAIVGRLTVRRFDLREPSLHEVFVRTVGGSVDA